MPTQTGTLKAGNQLVIDSIGSPVDYDVSVTGYAVDFKRIQQKNTLSLGPYKVDCSYSVTTNSGSPSIYKVQPNGQREYTAATLPDPESLAVGADAIVGGMPVQVKDGKFLGEYTVGSGIPFVVPSSGNITSASGDVTVTSAFVYIIGPSYTFFPQSALFAKSPAGWYYTVWSSTTVGKVYADVYYIDVPQIPQIPTPLTTVAGAYTQAKDYYAIGPSYIIPAGFMGNNGAIIWNRQVGCKNSANSKTFSGFFGMETFQSTGITTNSASGQTGSLVNRGVATKQCAANANYGDAGLAGSLNRLVVDTNQNQIFSLQVKLVDATDFAIIEAHTISIKRGE